MAPDPHVVAAAALDGPWRLEPLTERLARCPGWSRSAEIGDVVSLLLSRWRTKPRHTSHWADAWSDDRATRIVALLTARVDNRPITFTDPPPPVWRWPVHSWTTVDQLSVGLDLRDGELDWFSDVGGWLRTAPDGPLHHYRHRWTASRSGTPRLLETPAPRIQELQRRIARRVLDHIPVHDAAHGYVRGRSARTLAALHSGREMVVRLDLEGFFSHVTGHRVTQLFLAAGYPPAVASALAGLLVTTTPVRILRTAPSPTSAVGVEPRRRLLERLARTHLPQGAPTSPSVANLVAHRLDRRLAGLASAVGATYGRYADDLVFSGDRTLPAHGIAARVTAIAVEEGFRVRRDKTRVMPAHHRQRVTGLVVNASPSVQRKEYDALRALLHNCARTGPEAQNRTAEPAFRDHLQGRISWIASTNPARGARLNALFAAISWD